MQHDTSENRLDRGRDVIGLVAFLFACLIVSGIGGLVTATSVRGWYTTLSKPAFNPPDWVFAPVWTILYVLMAIAAWRVWRTENSAARLQALTVFGVQLALNLSWSILFFGFREVGLALADIVVLWSAIAFNAFLFWRIERLAGWLLFPYLLWVAFAAALNLSIWWLN
ncbi:MAG: TspO/MBR family protein [Sedimenticolaceae bacterium]|jgi:tryptophan-rich sensory protein